MATYLNQVTFLECGGGSYVIHNWSAHHTHIDNQLHKHSFFEICYVMGGEGLYLDGDQEFRLKSGDLFLSRPQVWHRIYEGRSLYLIWISFELDESISDDHALENIRRLQYVDHFFIRNAAQLPSVLAWQSILMQAERQNGLNDILVPLANGFLIALINSFLFPDIPEHQTTHSNPQRILQQAKSFIQDNLSQPLQLKDVAHYLHISERQLSRLFHEHGTQTFVQYLKSERLHLAMELLANTNKSLKDIAIEIGFESIHYFTRVFTASLGTPPGKYRSLKR
ncbi:putative HTH-type transcriptional regulator YfiF [Cohnella abietis]|uniref:Putative HTH-type transcriptional regulator YfiF n=2 Tax=Cohnella abietis TaxID=2507935 RepID=A0A3T1D0G1_9BACL|nr:putative HTH-type transcriptional regulator YfiF [Cohnella abietis]